MEEQTNEQTEQTNNPMKDGGESGEEPVLAVELSRGRAFTHVDRIRSAAQNLASTVHPKLKKHPKGITIAAITIIIDLIGELVGDFCA